MKGSGEVSDRPVEIKSPKWPLQGNCIPAALARIFAGSSTPAEILETLEEIPLFGTGQVHIENVSIA